MNLKLAEMINIAVFIVIVWSEKDASKRIC